MASPNDRVVLLFCHGSSFTKETWTPIIERLQKAPLLQRVRCEIVAFDWRFHGENFDHSEPPRVTFYEGIKTSPRVEHAASHWPEWTGPQLEKQIAAIRADDDAVGRRTRIVAIGHSMGATAQLKYEVEHPGTFDGFIGFEPIYESGWPVEQKRQIGDLLVSVALARESEWPAWEAVVAHTKSGKAFRRWHPEAVAAYLQSAIIKDGETYKLALTPHQEAATYCHHFVEFPAEKLAQTQCPLFIEHAERTAFFLGEPAHALAEKLEGKLTIGEVMPKTTHCMVLEDPDTSAQRILTDLAQLPLFQ